MPKAPDPRPLRTATTVEASSAGSPAELSRFVVEAERLGLDMCFVAEAWGSDAPSALGYLAARTSTIRLASGIIQLGTRTPALVAMTALTLAELSDGRFVLGLGASGPQVVEGLHGLPFARPVTRMRETIEVVRSAMTGEKLAYDGREVTIPLRDSHSRPMRLSAAPRLDVPIYIAAMSPAMLELTGQVADGWLGTSFVPEGSGAYFEHLERGLASVGRGYGDLDVCQGAEVAFLDTERDVATHVASRKKELAFSLGGMGSAQRNFYHDAYSRQGWADVAAEVRTRWQAGDHDGAAALVTDDMVLATTLIGTPERVRERLRTWREYGVTTVRLYPAGDTLDARIETLGRAIDVVRELDRDGLPG